MFKKFLFALVCFATSTQAQTPFQNNQSKFDEFTYRQGTNLRTASGNPGPDYWQNGADYKLEVELDENNNTLSGTVEITYYNNSPEPLSFVWIHLEQNRYKDDSRGALTTPIQGYRFDGDLDGGYKISNVVAKTGTNTSKRYLITDTRMQVFFDEPIAANGGKATISMNFSYKIPGKGLDRMGRLDVKNGTIYSMAQWYPRVAVFDDVLGWNTEPYLGAGEFYLGYGDFDFKITVPYDHIVVASGALQNEKEVLPAELQKRMRQAEKSDQTIHLIKPDEVGKTQITRPKQNGKLTWHFVMENTRDIAFASSKAFIWDAARINLPEGKKAIAQSAYPIESNGDNAWERSTEYTKASIEYYSEQWFPYPYPAAVNVASNVGGMEYPGISFCGFDRKGSRLWGVTDHEFGHMWFPMIVGSNEKKHVWMDEGFNTFINYYSTKAFNNGEYNTRLGRDGIIEYNKNPNREPIATHPDITQSRNLGMTAYYKPAYGLLMLREYILGHERFDNAFKSYINAWAYKHPQPNDFFNHMENVAGEDLNWFWKHWFYSNDNIDLAIEAVDKVGSDFLLTFKNNGFPMPLKFEVTYEDGQKEIKELPVEVWQRSNRWIYLLKTDKKLKEVTIDPDKITADIDDTNNHFTLE
ncbi:M1 family metallopeptidase [uncultured Planktosalinus sp.]|uniref:M1 family metallopeptidase n=1 Tax=uncultured Planktosalinus sp. TaxID=1810935 RepID=UPI0030D83ED3